MPTPLRLGLAFSLALFTACQGSSGAPGLNGTNGTNGSNGTSGTNGCDGLPGGTPVALHASLAVSAPTSGGFFAAGQQPILLVRILDQCGRVVPPAALDVLDLYLAGPRAPTLTRTASKLLNAVTNRSAPDRQHHFVNLKAPSYADPARPNLAALPDGTLSYTLSPVTDEPAGTYTAGLWVESAGAAAQTLEVTSLQIGTSSVETYASGAPASATCRACHLGARSGRVDLQHAFASPFAPAGMASLDQAPVESCQLCHNLDGYSANPTVRKVHGLHRGASQLAPGAAHPEYGLGADATLLDFTNVVFPSMPAADRDCAACHTDLRWATRPSRLACGTCHDNLYFDTGTLSPPRLFGRPAAGACAVDLDCASFGALATCDPGSGSCQRASHPTQANDSSCSTCHTSDSVGLSPVPARHDIPSRTQTTGLALSNVVVAGGTGPGGGFQVGDVPVVSFGLADQGGPVLDLKTNAALSATAVVGGPVEARQRVFGPLTLKSTGTLAADATGHYSYTFPAGWPFSALTPLNASAGAPPPFNPPGSYTVYVYVTRAVTVSGQTFRDAASSTLEVPFGGATVTRPRQVVTTAACNGCHVQLQAHGGARVVAEACGLCHTAGAVDRGVGSLGLPCTTTAQCPGFGWETCLDTNADAIPDTCVVTVDPTPGATIELGPLAHSIHFGRLLGGYAERNDLASPGRYQLVAFRNTLTDFSQGLLPQDPRNCTACHADAGNACTSDLQCGAGQACSAGGCANVAWLQPSGRACLSCHDTAATAGHAALNTWASPDGAVETCGVCHGPGAVYAPDLVHQVGVGVLPVARTP